MLFPVLAGSWRASSSSVLFYIISQLQTEHCNSFLEIFVDIRSKAWLILFLFYLVLILSSVSFYLSPPSCLYCIFLSLSLHLFKYVSTRSSIFSSLFPLSLFLLSFCLPPSLPYNPRHVVSLCFLYGSSIEWFKDDHAFLTVLWFGSSPAPPSSPVSNFYLFLSLPVCRR